MLERALERGTAILGFVSARRRWHAPLEVRGFRAERREIGWTKVEFTEAAMDDPIGRALVSSPDVSVPLRHVLAARRRGVVRCEADRMVQAYRLGDRAWGIRITSRPIPGLSYGWIGTYLDELLDNDADPVQIGSTPDATGGEYRQVAWDVSEAFVKVALG